MSELKQTKEGFWVISTDTHVGKWIEETGRLDHDTWLLDQVTPHIPEGGTAIDVGGLYGDHTIAYARKVGSKGMVVVFEPNPKAHECLVKNSFLFPECKLVISSSALSSGESGLKPHLNVNAGATLFKEVGEGESSSVQSEAFDYWWDREGDRKIDFIKIDAEGFEHKILLGMQRNLKRHRPKLLIEINTVRLRENGSNVFDILSVLSKNLGQFEHSILPQNSNYLSEQYDLLIQPV